MTPEEKMDALRHAKITSNDNTPVLEALAQVLPPGFQLKDIEPEKKLGNYDIVIQTPTDEICLVVSKDGLSASTSNIMKQDHLSTQPSLQEDELSKLAVKLKDNEKIDFQVVASKNDLEGK